MDDREDRAVWYASYGSNCAADRFHLYLTGGRVPGSERVEDGARDSRLPRASEPVEFGRQICFTGSSSVWGHAPAFLEHRPAERGAYGVRYLITWGQLDDVVAQESRRPSAPLPIAELTTEGSRATIGTGAYDGLLALTPQDGIPVVTFTAPSPPELRPSTSPAASYLGTILRGLAAHHSKPVDDLVDRLLAAPGVQPTWDRASIRALLD